MVESWSAQEIDELKTRWSKGQSIFEIGKALQRSPESIKSKLRRLHLPLGNQRHPRYQYQGSRR